MIISTPSQRRPRLSLPPVITVLTILASLPLAAQSGSLLSGPMVCYSSMTEVKLWVQTTAAARVKFRYREEGTQGKWEETEEITTSARDAFTAQPVAGGLEPGRLYEYEIWIDATKVSCPYPLRFRTQRFWQWREEPPPFTIALGSCAYINEPPFDRPGEPYGGEYEIFTSIAARRPDAMLWLGDNIYLREVDFESRSGILHRYTHARALPELQPLLGSTHHYAIWDDHDYGPNDADRGYRMKEEALEAFKLFWGNPTYGTDRVPGITTSFEWADVEFFLLDNRYHRSPNDRTTGDRQILGDEQIELLIDRLVSSRATFKLVAVGGQVLNPVARFENHATYPKEREKLLAAIAAEKIPGVVFVDGDRHHSELTKMDREGTYPLYDLTVSPLTSRPYNDTTEANTLRVEGTYVGERNFAILEFSGPYKERRMKITMFNVAGKELWSRTIGITELQ